VYYRDLLLSYGAAEVYYVPVTVDHKGNNSSPEVVRQVRSLTGFFFGGGDQLRIVDSFYNGDAGETNRCLHGVTCVHHPVVQSVSQSYAVSPSSIMVCLYCPL
jgi:cyanophycinase-like exopeptidase